MSCLGNIIWFIFGGLVAGLQWFLTGLLWCITIVGIPVGIQCFKLAKLQFAPFLLSITIIGIPFAAQSLKMAKLSLAPFGKDVI